MDTIRLISNEYGDTPLVESYRTLRSIYSIAVMQKIENYCVLHLLQQVKVYRRWPLI